MRLKVWVVKERVNRLEFAKALGVAPTTFSGYCSGDRMPSPEKLLRSTICLAARSHLPIFTMSGWIRNWRLHSDTHIQSHIAHSQA